MLKVKLFYGCYKFLEKALVLRDSHLSLEAYRYMKKPNGSFNGMAVCPL